VADDKGGGRPLRREKEKKKKDFALSPAVGESVQQTIELHMKANTFSGRVTDTEKGKKRQVLKSLTLKKGATGRRIKQKLVSHRKRPEEPDGHLRQ